jgi:esterase/lipase superfamily enzyme
MNVEYHKEWSQCLNQEMEFKVYGSSGKPVLVFPTQGGRFFEFEDFGMVQAVDQLIGGGFYQFYTVDSIDKQSWSNWNILPYERAKRHEDYDRYITQEISPYIQCRNKPGTLLLATGCSMGGYHATNFFFRHPDLFDSLISMSGLFQLKLFVGDYMDDTVYFNSPLYYLRNLNDPCYLEKYRHSKIIICAGQGAWEEEMNNDIQELRQILEEKKVPAWIDLWGHDVNHDWPWWQKQLPYFLESLNNQDR